MEGLKCRGALFDQWPSFLGIEHTHYSLGSLWDPSWVHYIHYITMHHITVDYFQHYHMTNNLSKGWITESHVVKWCEWVSIPVKISSCQLFFHFISLAAVKLLTTKMSRKMTRNQTLQKFYLSKEEVATGCSRKNTWGSSGRSYCSIWRKKRNQQGYQTQRVL